MNKARLGLMLITVSALLRAADIHGLVIDSNGGEPLARVRISVNGKYSRTVTGPGGVFTISGVTDGPWLLEAETVGYYVARVTVAIANGQDATVRLVVTPDSLTRTDSVTVTSGVFEEVVAGAPAQTTLSGNDLRNLSNVIVEDPLRSVSSLPGVFAGNDYLSTFSVRAAPFSAIGIYLDGVLMRAPAHSFGGDLDGYSISTLNDQTIESLTLLPGAYPPQYGDRIGAALAVETREGSDRSAVYRFSVGMSDVSGVAEGPIGGRATWLVAGRKSYLGYAISRLGGNAAETLTFDDAQGQFGYRLTPGNTLSALILAGRGDYKSGADLNTIPARTPFSSKEENALVQLNWRYSHGDFLLWKTTGAWQRANDSVLSGSGSPLESSHYTEWTLNSDASLSFSPSLVLQAGYSGRVIDDGGISPLALFENPALTGLDTYRGGASPRSGYLQQTWSGKSGKIRLAAGLRRESDNKVSTSPVLPWASASYQLSDSSRLELGWGQYAQFPEVNQVFTTVGRLSLLPERSTHYSVAFEQRLSRQTRLRVEAYDRNDRDVLDTPFLFPRLVNGSLVWPVLRQQLYNSARGYSRGAEIVLERRSANRLSGWISCNLGYARQRDGLSGIAYAADDDQRKAVKVVLSYRIKPSINLSGKWTYGSGTPVPGYFRQVMDLDYVLSDLRNASRFPDYYRMDFRFNKSFVREKWKTTLYAEVVNATNHNNVRYLGVAAEPGGVVVPRIGTTVSLLPSVGVSFEL